MSPRTAASSRPCENFLYVFKAARVPGRTRRRLGAWPSASAQAPATGPGRRRSAGAKSSRSHGAARRRRPVTGRSWPRPYRWPFPDLRGDPARGLTTGQCGQAAAPARPPVKATRPRPHTSPESSSLRDLASTSASSPWPLQDKDEWIPQCL